MVKDNIVLYKCIANKNNFSRRKKLHTLYQKDLAITLGCSKKDIKISSKKLIDDLITISVYVSKKTYDNRRKDLRYVYADKNAYSCFLHGLMIGYSKLIDPTWKV